MAKNNDSPYKKGRRWGFAVSMKSLNASKSNVYSVDKAMKTCAQNARSGCRKLNQNERDAYRGMSYGMYDAIMIASKDTGAPKKKSPGRKKSKK